MLRIDRFDMLGDSHFIGSKFSSDADLEREKPVFAGREDVLLLAAAAKKESALNTERSASGFIIIIIKKAYMRSRQSQTVEAVPKPSLATTWYLDLKMSPSRTG